VFDQNVPEDLMSWESHEVDFAQVYGKKGDPSQGDQMKN
jgi:hypothetical protein